MFYCKTAIVFFLLLWMVGLCKAGNQEGQYNNVVYVKNTKQKVITLQNWISHPEVFKVRKIYEDIQTEIKNGKINVKRREFDRHSTRCTEHSTFVSVELGRDEKGRVRFFSMSDMLTSEISGTKSYYYDKTGVLRFMLLILGDSEDADKDRIYFDDKGDFLFAVSDVDGRFFLLDYDVNDAITDRPIPPSEAEEIFMMEASCPEVK